MPHDTPVSLAEEYWETLLEANPSTATLLGDHRFDDRLEDLSTEAEQAQRSKWESLRELSLEPFHHLSAVVVEIQRPVNEEQADPRLPFSGMRDEQGDRGDES